ncbi:MAG: hypothetical protein EOO13_13145 [Chitinophagaceae bacterium]|nr:MAG: hypothetical protein EOO13_13145 [Chitinophagaceae bacterium]
MKFLKLMLLAFCCPLAALCQDITGLWTGTIFNDSTQQYHQYEVGITREKGKYTGFSHTWFMIGNTKYFGVKRIKVRIAADGKIIMEDGELMLNNYPVQPNKDVRQLNVLTLETTGTDIGLTGLFVTNRTKEFLSGFINCMASWVYSYMFTFKL